MRLTQLRPLALLAVAGVGIAAVVSRSADRPTVPPLVPPHASYTAASAPGLPRADLKKNAPDVTRGFTGVASATGTFKRPLLVVGDKRFELKASDTADASVAETLDKVSKGDTATYTAKGVLGSVNGNDGILVESITPAKANLGTGAPAAPKRPGYKVYDHVIKATPPATGEHKFRLVVPEGLEVVRGILVVGPYSGGDSRDYHEQAWYGEFLNLHGFAFLGATNYYLHDYTVMQTALKQFATDSKHPELVNAPYAATGFSAGGGYTRKLMHADPDKVIAGVVVGSTMKLPGQLTDAHRRVPMCVINGELERDPGEGPGMAKHLEPVLAEHRPKGALWGWMAVQGVGHEFAGQEVLTMPILDAAVRLRYPAGAEVRKGPVKLKPVELESGWVADNTTWKSGLTVIIPAKQFKGDVAKSSWLLNEDIAFIYLPPTAMREGRRSKPNSHRYYMVPVASIPPDQFSTAPMAASASMEKYGHPGPRILHFAGVLDVIGTGGQVACPPTLHESGEVREWNGGQPGEPAVVQYPDLLRTVNSLLAACGYSPRKTVSDPRVKAAGPSARPPSIDRGAVPFVEVAPWLKVLVNNYLDALPPAVSGKGGDKQTFRVAAALTWGFALDCDTALQFLAERYNPRCLPPWTVEELRHKVECASNLTNHQKPRGYLLRRRIINTISTEWTRL